MIMISPMTARMGSISGINSIKTTICVNIIRTNSEISFIVISFAFLLQQINYYVVGLLQFGFEPLHLICTGTFLPANMTFLRILLLKSVDFFLALRSVFDGSFVQV